MTGEPPDGHAEGHRRPAAHRQRPALRRRPELPALTMKVVHSQSPRRSPRCSSPSPAASAALRAAGVLRRDVRPRRRERARRRAGRASGTSWPRRGSRPCARCSTGTEAQRDGRGSPISFAQTDPVVRRAALRNIDVLPVVFYAPRWARAYREPLHLAAEAALGLRDLPGRAGRPLRPGRHVLGRDIPSCRSGRCASGRSGTSRTCRPTGTPPRRARTATRAPTRCSCALVQHRSRASTRARRS